MRLNITAIPENLRANTIELATQLKLKISKEGYPVKAAEGEELSVSFDGASYNITYPALNQYYRALLIIKKKGDSEPYTVKESCNLTELGIMLDCSRVAVRNITHLKEFIRHLALMGYNQLQLYTEDTYEVENEPYFGYMRGRYTATELKELDDYAYSYGIELVPCIQVLAHLENIFRWREYKPVNDVTNILLIDDERTYTLIENMFSSIAKNFRSKKVNIGMDEAHLVGRGKYQDQHGAVENRSELILKHLNRVVEIAKRYEFRPMMWSDMFFRLVLDGRYYQDEGPIDISPEIIAKVPEGLRLVFWDYYHTEYGPYNNMLKHHLLFNTEVGFAGGAWTWLGFTPHNGFSVHTMKPALKACRDNGIDKVMFTLWGDNGTECSTLGVLPSLCMYAEYLYGNGDDYAESFEALSGIELDDYLKLDLPDILDRDAWPDYNNRSKFMLYNDCIAGLWDNACTEGQGMLYSDYAEQLLAVEKRAGNYSYIFKTLRLLCEALAIKFDLSLRIRLAYKDGDKEKLKEIVKEFTPLIKKINGFYKAFKIQWHKENKPFGFEIHDYRLGGLVRRVEHCREMLADFIYGKTDKIEQLEEVLLNPNPNMTTFDCLQKFDEIISANKI